MATILSKPVSRQLRHTVLQGRPVILTLGPGDVLTFRGKGRRHFYTTTAEACLWMAAKAEAREVARLKALARKERKTRR